MTDWLHCNTCFRQPGEGIGFSLTNCGHIYCEKCSRVACNERCSMCGSVCDKITLSGRMKPDVEMFFTSPSDMHKKDSKKFYQVMEFQDSHRRRFVNHLKDKIAKMEKFIQNAQRIISQYQDMERELSKTKEENLYLKRLMTEKVSETLTCSKVSQFPFGLKRSNISLTETQKNGIISQHHIHSSLNCLKTYDSTLQMTPGKYSPVSRGSPGFMQSFQSSSSSGKVSCTPPSGRRGSPAFHQQSSSHSSIAPGRLSVRTPPSGGKIGTVPGTPQSASIPVPHTPKSVPHPISLKDWQLTPD
ncbi:unnamed protein product [Mytilus coruscus]|uniref:RING-type domain-containing protein n=1 Tax=Mytilus coruscus TaxID=42192 RepID=A0A6J8AV63_MYTCO|nr:unnamed protein product [Mytilus coruscus]